MPTSKTQGESQELLLSKRNPVFSNVCEFDDKEILRHIPEAEESLRPVSEDGKLLKAKQRFESTSKDEERFNAEDNIKTVADKKKCLLSGIVFLNVLLVALIVSTYVSMASENKNIRRESGMCLNCTLLKLYPEDDLSMYSMYEGNICCVKDGGSYSSMVERLIERQLKENLISESPEYQPLHCEQEDRSTPVIKLMGRLTDIADTKSTRFPWIRWDLDVLGGHGSVNGQLTYDDKFITVGSTGIYMIYSQLVFHNKKPEGPSAYSSGTDKYYLHGIYRASESGQDERLLGGHYTYFQNQDQTEITSYVGSPYQLSKGDRLGVKVHDFNQIVPSNLTNFFGMHLIE